LASGGQLGKTRAGVEGELIDREVLRVQVYGPGQGFQPGGQVLPGQAEDQVEVEVGESRPAGQDHGVFALGSGVGPAADP